MKDNDGLKQIIGWHIRQYPRMEVQDLIKLVYQNEFGGGHLIADETDSLNRLGLEIQSLAFASGRPVSGQPLFEDIGNGLCRLNLAQLGGTGVGLSAVNRFFVTAANSVAGSGRNFRAKLILLRQILQELDTALPGTELDDFLRRYDFLNCPPPGHSEAYRLAYAPAYRIVKTDCRDFFPAFGLIGTLLQTRQSIIVAIDGSCGAGKSSLADLCRQVYSCSVIPMDHFFLPPELRTPDRLRETGGNIDYDRFASQVAAGLRRGGEFAYQRFDCCRMELGEIIRISPGRLTVIEGSYSMHPKFSGLYDLKIGLKIDPDEQVRRILQREGPEMLQRFVREWIPMENRYFQELKIMDQCDLVIHVPNSSVNP